MPTADLDLANTFTLSAGTFNTLDSAGTARNLTIGGSWAITGAAVFTPNTSLVTFDGTLTTYTITATSSGTDDFYDVKFNKTGAMWTLASDLTATNDLTITAGTLDTATYKLTLSGGNSDLIINGGTLDASDASSDLDIGDNVTVTSGTLSAPAVLDDTSFIVRGSWEISGTGIFVTNNGRVFMQGGGQTLTNIYTMVTTSSGADDFYDVKFANLEYEWAISDALTVNNNFTFQDGTLYQEAALTVGGNYSQSGGTTTQTGNLTVTGNYSLTGGGKFTCASPATYTFSVGGSFTVSGASTLFNRYTGSGTAADPLIIRDVYDLQGLATRLTSTFKLNADIDASVTDNWGSTGFAPIGSDSSPFAGTLDGNNHTITGLYVNVASGEAGLFHSLGRSGGYIASVTNLGLVDVDITGTTDVGALAGKVTFGYVTISNCYSTTTTAGHAVTGTGVSGSSGVGGLVGTNQTTISDSYSSADVVGDWNVGGFVGFNSGTVDNCQSYGDVIGNGTGDDGDYHGGFDGRNEGIIRNSTVYGSVTSSAPHHGDFSGGGNSPLMTNITVAKAIQATETNPTPEDTSEGKTTPTTTIPEQQTVVSKPEVAGPGFNWDGVYDQTKKYSTLYTEGTYRATVSVTEGAVRVEAIQEVALAGQNTEPVLLTANQSMFVDGRIGSNTK